MCLIDDLIFCFSENHQTVAHILAVMARLQYEMKNNVKNDSTTTTTTTIGSALSNMTRAVEIFEQTLGSKHPITRQHQAILDQFKSGKPIDLSSSSETTSTTSATTSKKEVEVEDDYPQWMSFVALILAIVFGYILFFR